LNGTEIGYCSFNLRNNTQNVDLKIKKKMFFMVFHGQDFTTVVKQQMLRGIETCIIGFKNNSLHWLLVVLVNFW